jgi:hypothetical protein
MLRLAFGRPWRQTEGLLGSIIDLLGLELAVPDHTTFSRRSANLRVASALKKADGPVHVVIDARTEDRGRLQGPQHHDRPRHAGVPPGRLTVAGKGEIRPLPHFCTKVRLRNIPNG